MLWLVNLVNGRGVKLVSRGPDASYTGHVHPGTAKVKNIAIQVPQKDRVCGLDQTIEQEILLSLIPKNYHYSKNYH